MRILKLAGALAVVMAAGACYPTTDLERGLVGAAAGAVISDVTGGNAATGALIGGVGGLVCDDLGVCK